MNVSLEEFNIISGDFRETSEKMIFCRCHAELFNDRWKIIHHKTNEMHGRVESLLMVFREINIFNLNRP